MSLIIKSGNEMEIVIKLKLGANNSAVKVSKYTLKGKYLMSYRSAYLAAKENYGNRVCISNCCKGIQANHQGFIWKYCK